MNNLSNLFNIFITSVFIENILLSFFLGMCSFLAVSKRVDTAMGLGIAVTFVLIITAPINWIINDQFLVPNALAKFGLVNTDLSFLRLIIFISVIAAVVQLVEMIIEKFSPSLYMSLGIFLPLIAVNCAILGVSLFMVEKEYSFIETLVFSFGSGVGWWLAILAMACIRDKISYSNIPNGMEGLGITMITTGLMAMGFMCFGGISLTSEQETEDNVVSNICYNNLDNIKF